MARVVLGVVGAVIGGYFGGPQGAQIGFAIGSAIGGAFEPPIEGPKLSDTQVQISSYGAGLNRTWGSDRMAGNVIWSTDLVEHPVEEGKGGPATINYTYSVSCAIAICEGERGGVRRIWADSKLVYDISDDADVPTQAASAEFGRFFTFYSGSESQLPDPTIESHEGVGNVEAYRGVAYIVFTDLPLQDYGNRLPQFTFEVTPEVPASEEVAVYNALSIRDWTLSDGRPVHTDGLTEYEVGGETFDTLEAAEQHLRDTFGEAYSTYLGYSPVSSGLGPQSLWDAEGALAGLTEGGGPRYAFLFYNISEPDIVIDDGEAYWENPAQKLANAGANPCGGFISYLISSHAKFAPAAGYSGNGFLVLRGTEMAYPLPPEYEGLSNAAGVYPVGSASCSAVGLGPEMWHSGHVYIRVTRQPSPPPRTCGPGDPCLLGIAMVPGSPDYCMTCDGEVVPNQNYEIVTGSFRQLQRIAYNPSSPQLLDDPGLGPTLAPGDPNFNNFTWWQAQADAAGLTGTLGVDYMHDVTVAARSLGTSTSAGVGSKVLGALVAEICETAGLTEAQIDTSDLVDIVPGYTLGRQMSARAAIEPLARAWPFAAVESGAVLRFVPRGGPVVASIPPEELGAGTGAEPVPLQRRTRQQETELPAVVAVAYKCREADYQAGAQTARRSAMGSQQELGLELAIVLSDQRAAEIADIALYDAWSGRVRTEWTTTRAWAHLEPTDVVDVDDGDLVRRLRIVDKLEDGPVIRWVGVDDDPAVLSTNSLPSTTSGGGGTVRFDGPMKLAVLDAPLLRSTDLGDELLLAAAGYRSEWRGGRVFEARASSTTFNPVADITQASTLGYTLDALGDWEGGNVVDESNSVTVRLHSGALESLTRSAMLAGGNAMALGAHGRWEILRAQRCELIEERTYRLSGLLRGRFGTEHAIGTHEIGDMLVLLDPSRLTPAVQPSANVGLELRFKGVAYGTALADALEQSLTYEAVALRPLSPSGLMVARLADGSTFARWKRRSRYPTPWLSAALLPLGESSEQYRLTVLDGETEVLQQTVSTTECVVGEVSASLALSLVRDLAVPAQYLQEVSTGQSVGVSLVASPSGSTDLRARAFDAFGGLLAFSDQLGNAAIQVAHGASAMYVLAFFYSGSTYADTTIHRIAYSDITASPTTRASTSAGDWQGVAFDGTHLWVTEQSSGDILKLNASTLATVSSHNITTGGAGSLQRLFFSGGYLWVVCGERTLVQFDIATDTEVDRFDLAIGVSITDVLVADGKLFVAWLGTVGVFDASTYAQTSALSGVYADTYGQNLLRVGELVAVSAEVGIRLLDAGSGAPVASVGSMAYPRLSGIRDGNLFLTAAGASSPTREYSLGSYTPAPDLSGKTLRVQQVSVVVGPGYAAEITIP